MVDVPRIRGGMRWICTIWTAPPSWHSERAARRNRNCSSTARAYRWLTAGDLLGLKKGRQWRLPPSQFDADAKQGFVPGLAKASRVFAGGAVSLTD
ncbi:helix-turn-helix domain-containing protein [Rhodococcus sp. 14C212]|uniref:helix-turn-helix domain-containing protein n=1 Tax=Rhodococcus sp. 14C212 TaxID=2711209 RepID=UPI0013EDB6AA|nr:helix-turn-helix domain-containing protein [Rhodococcus sp. 14C212]NGP09550.1 helix-turn-helix domain-containing protein [Rhodococcus sp. 14C212]